MLLACLFHSGSGYGLVWRFSRSYCGAWLLGFETAESWSRMPVTAGHQTLICWAPSSQVLACRLGGARYALKQLRRARPPHDVNKPPNNPSTDQPADQPTNQWRHSDLRVCHDHINQLRTLPTDREPKAMAAVQKKQNPKDERLTLQVFWRLQFHQVACLRTARGSDSKTVIFMLRAQSRSFVLCAAVLASRSRRQACTWNRRSCSSRGKPPACKAVVQCHPHSCIKAESIPKTSNGKVTP